MNSPFFSWPLSRNRANDVAICLAKSIFQPRFAEPAPHSTLSIRAERFCHQMNPFSHAWMERREREREQQARDLCRAHHPRPHTHDYDAAHFGRGGRWECVCVCVLFGQSELRQRSVCMCYSAFGNNIAPTIFSAAMRLRAKFKDRSVRCNLALQHSNNDM